jgi:hypothetical protein
VSRLSDCQIRALLPGMEETVRWRRAAGFTRMAERAQARIDAYRAELAARARGEAVQDPQRDRRVGA